MTAVGGGAGGAENDARTGGSGGGGNGNVGSRQSGATGSQGDSGGGTGYGNDGGDGASSPARGGGGGGADEAGNIDGQGFGGDGKLFSTFTGYGTDSSNVASTGANGGYFGGGGAGGNQTASPGIGGGGTNEGDTSKMDGLANTGGGGGANNHDALGGDGGTGVVLIAYEQEKPGTSSIAFDGTGDYLYVDNSSTFKLGDTSASWTIEFWIRLTSAAADYIIIDHRASTIANGGFSFYTDVSEGGVGFDRSNGTTWGAALQDPTQNTLDTWYHYAVVQDGGSTLKMYRDGTEVDSTTTLMDDDSGTYINWFIGGGFNSSGSHSNNYYMNGYLDEIRVSDSARYTSAFTPQTTQFTADANTMLLIHSNWDGGLGADSSGNFNTFTPTNLVATDQMVDSPTNNFCTLNPLDNDAQSQVFAEGNLKGTTDGYSGAGSSFILPSSGKWYAECYASSVTSEGLFFGIADPAVMFTVTKMYDSPSSCAVYRNDGLLIYTGGNNTSTDINTFTDGDIISIAVDVDADEIWIAKNNVWQGASSPNPSTGTSGHDLSTGSGVSYTVIFGSGTTNDETGIVNFGQDSSFAGNVTAQGNQDANSVGDFYYEPPTDFLALCTSNLPDPEIKLPGDNFNPKLYTGDGSTTLAVTGVGFQPDFTWIKNRDATDNHIAVDAVRGANNYLIVNGTNPETDDSTFVASLDSDGFTVGNDVVVNTNTENYASWNWLGGNAISGTGDFTQGTIPSTCSRNVDAGFSIVSYTGNATTGATVGHGLSETPQLIIVKRTDTSASWIVYSEPVGGGAGLFLNTDEVPYVYSGYFNNTSPTASVFTLGNNNDVNGSSPKTYMAYCFHSIEGYSKVDSYEGNNNANGTFIYTGFRPAFLLLKNVDAGTTDWMLEDDKRLGYNVDNNDLIPNQNYVEATDDRLDIVSNGFKLRGTQTTSNASNTYLYYAAAAYPFKYSPAR